MMVLMPVAILMPVLMRAGADTDADADAHD